ncbi:MAG: tetratricopeptide repeat protein, partial [bacterium]|nr:tetratricopeptide repeat protein [bacterium]
MAHTPDHARRLIRELEPRLPHAAELVLDRPKYWDPRFVELFFEYTEELIFRNPKAALHVALVARRLAHAMPEGETMEERLAGRERLVKGHGLVGSAYRAAGRLDDAERTYESALRLCERPRVSPACRAELDLRVAILRAFQKKFDQGLRHARRAEKVFGAANDSEWLGRVLATQGVIYVTANRFPEAVSVLGRALGNYRLIGRFEFSSTLNLALAVSETDDSEGLKKALVQLRRARKLAGPRRSVHKSVFYWIEGRIFVRCGSTERAERSYRK